VVRRFRNPVRTASRTSNVTSRYQFQGAASLGEGEWLSLKWARDQNPPCPWNEITAACAAVGIMANFERPRQAASVPCSCV